MDDLFQKAGELYPLKTTGSDWDAVAGKLQNEIPGEADDLSGPAAIRSRNKRKWLLLLLLIPMGLGISYYSGRVNPGPPNGISSGTKNGSADQIKTNPVVPDNHAATVAPADKNTSAASDNMQALSDKKNTVVNNLANGTQPVKNKRPVNNTNEKSSAAFNNLNLQKQIPAEAGNTKTDLNSSVLNSNTKDKGLAATGTVVAANSVDNHSAPTAESAQKTKSPAAATVTTATTAAITPAVTSAETKLINTDSASKNLVQEEKVKNKTDSNSATKKTNSKGKINQGFYVGLVAGPDISSVDFQAIKHPGYSLGATIGYRFNKKLAVETGFIYDKKYYYSDGAHYKNQTSMYSIVNVDGSCDMFEIPLLLRYDFSSNKNGGFFAKGGFSSYLMRKQTYSGVSTHNGYDTSWGPSSNYPQENYFFSIIQLSGGYEFSISGKTKIQIEPYVKIPLQGIGSGSMPISSAGIYFGITHSFR
jgi:hypothetical protein